MARPEGAWRPVAWSMAVGAAYDAAFAIAILLAPEASASALGIALPADRVYLGLNGVLLLLLAGIYVLPARDPVRYQGVVAVVAVGRVGGFIYLTASWLGGRAPAFLALALGDLALGAAHGLLLARARRFPPPSR